MLPAAAGPVGRDAQAATDLTMRAQVLTYSRSRGLFLGVSLSGAVIRQDDGDVRAFYGKDWTFYSLLNGEVPPPQDSLALLNTVERYAPTKRAALPAAGSVSAPAPTPAAAPAPAEAAPATAPAVDPASTSTAAPVEPTATASPATTPAKVPAPAAVPASTAPADPADPGNSLR